MAFVDAFVPAVRSAFLHAYHTDHANAAIHCAAVRYSPITFRLAEAVWWYALDWGGGDPGKLWPDDFGTSVDRVIADRGSYPEDAGR